MQQDNSRTPFRLGVRLTMVAALAVTAAAIAAFVPAAGPQAPGAQAAQMDRKAPVVKAVPAAAAPAIQVNVADVVERVSPSVVTVVVGKNAPETEMGPNQVPEQFREFFERFFGGPGMPQLGPRGPQQGPGGPQGQPSPERRVQGLGSGFVIDQQGYIVTSYHVIAGADKVTVVLDGDDRHEARVVGYDGPTDLALLKIDADRDLPAIPFGDSRGVRVGDWVLTLGNPFGVGKTANLGIISARHRDIGAGPFDDFLQIDAPINRGNSGGPALNLRGEVIGVNAAIFSPSGGNVGIGFAIPSMLAKTVIEDLKDDGKVDRGWLGVHIQEVTPELADSLDLEKPVGAIVARVMEGSPADKVDLRQGDVILAVNGETVDRLKQLPRIIGGMKSGTRVQLTVWRGGAERKVELTIGSRPAEREMAATEPRKEIVGGLQLSALDDRARRAFGIEDHVEGVVIIGIKRGGAAAERGLAPGDVIVSANGTSVTEPSQVVEVAEKAKLGNEKAILLLVQRSGSERFVALPLQDA